MKPVMFLPRYFFRWAAMVAGVASHLLASAAGPAPEVSISLRGVVEGRIEQGEPWRVLVRLDAPADATAPLELAPDTGSVAGCINVELLRAADQSLILAARPADAVGPVRATLDQERIVTGVWYFSAASMAGLARANTWSGPASSVRGSAGWTGDAGSPAVAVQVVPPANDPERASTRAIARAHDRLLASEPADAARELDAVLAQDPNDIEVLAMRAALSHAGR